MSDENSGAIKRLRTMQFESPIVFAELWMKLSSNPQLAQDLKDLLRSGADHLPVTSVTVPKLDGGDKQGW
jgi:hypothetical protein